MAKPALDASILHAILEHAPGFILFLDPDLRIRYINRVSAGYTVDEIIGQHSDAFHPPEQAARIRKAFERARDTGQEQSVEACIDVREQGKQWLQVRISVLRDDDGELVGYVNILADITEQKEAELQLKKAQAELIDASHRAGMAEVATGVLHNIGNVLNSVNVSAATLTEQVSRSHVDILKRAVALMEEQADDLPAFLAHDPRGRKLPALLGRVTEELHAEQDALRAEVKRLVEHVHLIRSTVEAQQSIARTGKPCERVDLAALVERAVSMFRIDYESWNIEVSVDIQEEEPVMLEKQSTLQILVNLIRNAIEAVTEGSGTGSREIDIHVYCQDRFIHFEVIDNGCGIAAENLTKIFHHGFTTRQHGHGFGLHASAVAARAMGGSLDAASDGPGCGARFCLTLPRHVART